MGKWVAAVLNEAQNDDGNASVRAQFWHNVSSQETHCKFSRSHLHSPAAVTVPQIFPIAQHMNIWCSKKKTTVGWFAGHTGIMVPVPDSHHQGGDQ